MQCHTCNCTDDGTADCELQECAEGEIYCVTQIENNTLRGDVRLTRRKRCLPANQEAVCENTLDHNTGEFSYRMYSKCCSTDGCNSGAIEMPDIDKTPNGKTCEACFVEDSLQCSEYKTIDCTGNQHECLTFQGLGQRPGLDWKNYNFKGCISSDACKADLTKLPASGVSETTKYSCSLAMSLKEQPQSSLLPNVIARVTIHGFPVPGTQKDFLEANKLSSE
ncbi:phospholipase A2 inhibitor and Ly6/PLAUR domain-containing protein-like [Pyxicephalus adspersus]|uniref:phospholipase A2 inhibitor and Ly6/PLAUR domain-containing protein-like n=1 Tax=Pyxicephalus adspersus TaxID=30357 RepID=UPI003B59BD68